MPCCQADIKLPPPLKDSTGDIDYVEAYSLQTAGPPACLTAQALEHGVDVVGDNRKPPPNGVGVKVVARKDATGKLIFQDIMRPLTMPATLPVPTHKLVASDSPICYNHLNFIARTSELFYRERVCFLCHIRQNALLSQELPNCHVAEFIAAL